MNTYSYDLLVDKSIKRKIKILQILLEANRPVSLKTFSSLCGVSYKTIQQDVAYLIEDLPNALLLEEFNHSLSLEKCGTTREIVTYIDQLVSDNPIFHLIESIFYEEKKDLITYALDLYISESTMKNYIKTFRKVLKDFKLDLDVANFSFIGEEADIRYFFFQYFRSIHESSAPIIHNDQYHEITEVLEKMKNDYDLNLNFDYYRATIWMFIIEKRIENQHFIQFDPAALKKYEQKDSYRRFKTAFSTFFHPKVLDEAHRNQEILFSYFAQIDTIIYESNSSYLTNDFIQEFTAQDVLITNFFIESKQNLVLNHEAKSAIQSYLTNLSILTECTDLFQKYSRILIRKAKTNYSTTFSIWCRILENHQSFSHIEDVAARLTLLYEVKKYNKKKVLFALTGDSSSVSYYKALAKKVISNDVEYHFLFNRPLTNELLSTLQIDLCVYNFEPQLTLSSSELYRLSDIPLDSEWQELQKLLFTT
ncbi:helix-turn-helix domain-containing protein [Enterococcus viikkiensis]|uniref:helix-turn-helix domain-containing protein n=1 Tax=Enterococcus viikkiensis TaxID=930854 RepID=UPI003F93EAFB